MNDQPHTSHGTWVVAFTAHSEPEAAIVAGRLQNEGIETFVHRETTGSNAYGVYLDPFGDVSVLVHSEDYERALNILEADTGADDAADADPEQPAE